MVACYENKCHYSCSGTNNISKIKHKSRFLCSTAPIANLVMIPLRLDETF